MKGKGPQAMEEGPIPRRSFLRRAACLAAAAGLATRGGVLAYPSGADASEDSLFLSATQLAAGIRQRRWTVRAVIERTIARIEEVEPKINALGATCFARALQEADRADEALATGRAVGALHGVPMTIKDSFDTEGVVSTAGTLGRRDFVPSRDATVVARARAAGAILLGKSNTPEFTLGGGWRGTENLVYGLTRNPYDVTYQPGASSGGAGAIVAAGGAAFDIGTDFGGSLRGPGLANGLAALKPTQGRCSRTGHILGYGGHVDAFQQVGPIARRVEDLALLLPIIAGPDGEDAALQPVPLGDPVDVDVAGLRVAWFSSNGLNAPTPEISSLVAQAVEMLSGLGCTVSEAMPPKMAELAAMRWTMSSAPGADPMRRLLARWGTREPSPGLDLHDNPRSTAEMTRAAEELDVIKGEQLAWFSQFDVLVCPGSTRAALPIDLDRLPPRPPGPRPRGISYVGTYNTNGWPAGVLRTGTSQLDPGLPLGVQVVGPPWRDDVVLAVMAAIERGFGGYQPPKLT